MKDIFDLTGKTAFITGASSGLGVGYAKALAERGANLVIVARREDKLNEAKAMIEKTGAKVLAVKCDVTDESQIESAVNKAIETFGKIDILINNAGTADVTNTVEMTQEKWKKVMSINLDAVVFVTKHVVPYMIKQNYGRIINISSMYGLRASTTGTIPSYLASKGAIVNLTRGWAYEFADYGITVNAIAPGFFPSELTTGIDTEDFNTQLKLMTPIGRMGRPEELHGLMIYLSSENASYLTGQTIPVDGGKTAI